MSRSHKECEGCNVCYGIRPYYKNKDGIIEECPCSKCLIKGICKHTCKAYRNYLQAYVLFFYSS